MPKRRDKPEGRFLKRTQEVLYQRDFKRANKAYNEGRNGQNQS